MRQVVLILAMSLTCSSAMAEWTKVYQHKKATVYVNLETIQRDENLVKMWSMSDYKSTQHLHYKKPYRSIKSQAEYDCNEKTRRIVSVTHYSGEKSKGEVVYSNAYFDKPWFSVTDGSPEDHEWEIACKTATSSP
jgi:hypothetical protein